jgi:MFS family permease
MLMDISSEMIHALLPVYLVTVLGTSMVTVGLIEGIAEAIASITKIFSGALSDWLGKRKLLAVVGYGLAAFTKPVFPLAPTISWLIGARFVDRVGKGIRGAPRDALIADIAPAHLRGASFGLRQSLDTVGAFLGPLLAIGLMWWTADNFKAVFWVAVVPAFLALAVMITAVREPARQAGMRKVRNPIAVAEIKRLGLPIAALPAVLVVMNVVYALAAYPAGVASDRIGRTTLLIVGLATLIAADLALALLPSIGGVALGVTLWGLHMGLTQGLFATLVADVSPPELRGTAFGFFNLLTGLAMLAASVIAGALWDATGPKGTFLAGACFAFLALGALPSVRGRIKPVTSDL